MKKTFTELVTDFISGTTSGTSSGSANLKIIDNMLFHFSTVIAERINGKIYVNTTKYSIETSRLQKILADSVPNDLLVKVSGFPMGYKDSLIK